jgi:hypothetical protein
VVVVENDRLVWMERLIIIMTIARGLAARYTLRCCNSSSWLVVIVDKDFFICATSSGVSLSLFLLFFLWEISNETTDKKKRIQKLENQKKYQKKKMKAKKKKLRNNTTQKISTIRIKDCSFFYDFLSSFENLSVIPGSNLT